MALVSAAGPLTQPRVPLPAAPARFVRLVWLDLAAAPVLTGAAAVFADETRGAGEPLATLEIAASPEPADAKAGSLPRGALHFDLGAALPVTQIDLQLPAGTRVVPAQVQGRSGSAEPWHDVASTVFYRIERDGEASRAPPLEVPARPLRFVRVVPDERAGALDTTTTKLAVQAALASLVFAHQGTPPYRLQAGAAAAPAGALPAATLVPALDSERARFGTARLGDWHEVEAVARDAEAAQRLAALRPWVLWAVLVGGVVLLAALVWRLARGARA